MDSKRTTALTAFGDRSEVRELAERLQMVMPGANKLTGVEATALAQVAVAHGLDPFNGEVWLIKNREGVALGLMVGIKGLRKLARRQLKRESEEARLGPGAMWTSFEKVADVEAYSASKGDIVYRCELRDSLNTGAWIGQLATLKATIEGGVDQVKAAELIGRAPVTIGIGIYKAGEATKMKPDECARKRAEAHAIKQRFDVDFAEVSEEDGEVIDAEFREAGEKEPYVTMEHDKKPKSQRTAVEINDELGFQDDQATTPAPTVEAISLIAQVAQRIEDLAHQASQRGELIVTQGMRGLLVGTLNSIFGDKQDRYLFCGAVAGAKSSKDITDEYVVALLDFFDLHWEEGKAPRPADAAKEQVDLARRVLREIHVAAGQAEMPA